ncbi:MAG: hypothetical protein PHY74_03920 [Candidatus Bathyarchaeota archaeon]|nr:hypothetical protein [Candidatus Bathyarchaeota archaeon]MDT8782238.1 hypothetical protein [Candidatus Bathyarchaeota archaeon]
MALAGFASTYIALLAAFVFTFIVPGLCFYRFFSLDDHEKWAFIPIFSVLFSVQFVYVLSLLSGYSRNTILICFLALTTIYTLVIYKKGQDFQPQQLLQKFGKIKKTSIMLFTVILLVSLGVLLRTVWFSNDYGIVITGANWQDTPFHYEIIESINNGNFPPQTPNYVGTSLSYHYFVDFHTAIVEKVYGYLPTLLPILNAVFIGVFAVSMYALVRPHGRQAAIAAAVVGTFGWGFSYYKFFSALFCGESVVFNSFFEYGGTFGLPPIYDNLLQQRPMLMGLPALVLVLTLLRNMDDKKRLLLAGLVTGLVYQFNNVAFFCCFVAYAFCLFVNLKKFKLSYLFFVLPSLVALPFILGGGATFQATLNVAWAIQFVKNPLTFYILNLGLPLLLAIYCFFKRGNWYLKGTMLALLIIPHFVIFTPNVWDMYKFFMFAWIPIAALAGISLAKTRKLVAFILVLLSILTSVSVIVYNINTNFMGATWAEYNVGIWTRENTPENSVFLTYYYIHAPTSMIGGRLRVSSDINWPYGHGIPLEDIWAREEAIDNAYAGSVSQLEGLIREYNVSYVYVGSQELSNYPNCISHFNSISWLTSVYNEDEQYVYQVEWIELGS